MASGIESSHFASQVAAIASRSENACREAFTRRPTVMPYRATITTRTSPGRSPARNSWSAGTLETTL